MRITRTTLLKAAKTFVAQRTAKDRHIICVYLTGSLIDDLPLLGGTADIDLVIVHDDAPPAPREIVRLTPNVHIDLAHHSQSIYKEPKQLRLDPWVGSYLIKDPIVLHGGSQHWFEFVQASVFSQFNNPENVYKRAMPLIESARQTWLNHQLDPQEANVEHVWGYLKALEDAANALVLLGGPPLTERRFLLSYPERAEALGHPEMASAFTNLVLPDMNVLSELPVWIESWKKDLTENADAVGFPMELHPHRLNYYTNAVEALSSDFPSAAAWILLRTWTRFALHFNDNPKKLANWQQAFSQAQLYGDAFQTRLDELDQYLDMTEEIIEGWAAKNGVETLI